MQPELAITDVRQKDGKTVLTIDTAAARYKGLSWRELGSYGKRKFETLLMLKHAPKRIHAIYA